MADYFPDVSWSTIASNVIPYRTGGTVFVLNTYLIDIYPIDSNEAGASTMEVAVNDYFIDYLGYPYTVLNVATISTYKQIRVYDINERSISESINYGPYTNQIGYVYRPINGAVVLSQAQLLNLDAQARDRINNIEKGVIWENRGISLYDGSQYNNISLIELGNNLSTVVSGEDPWNGGIAHILGVNVTGTNNGFLTKGSSGQIVNSEYQFSTLDTLADEYKSNVDETKIVSESYIPVINEYWRDIDFPIIIRTTGANIPTLTTINGNLTMPTWAVNDFNQCESQEFVHEWKQGSTCYWHIHLTTNGLDVDNRYVRFEVEYGYVTPNGQWVFPAVIDSGDLLIPANTPNETMFIFSIGNFTPTGVKIGGHCVARLKRITATGTAPTSNPWCPMLQQHVLCDSLGSRSIASK